ncbi:MAG: hypothetical protein KAV87_68590 [Desulfobacteraceae bacterium]|nr:hypothetical protein [Desulfobacteraceae bacterium]
MKIIISHDVDHITAWEHKKDLIIPKLAVRSSIELVIGKIGFTEYLLRFKELARNKWQNLEELMRFDKENKVSSTFFVGVNNGLGLSYSLENAKYWIKKIVEKGFDVGAHGLAFNNYDDIKDEYDTFRNLAGLEKFGIRIHYVRKSEDTLKFLDKAGYIFDSTLCKLENPFKAGNLWEFPLHVMDDYVFTEHRRWQTQTLEQAEDKTKRIIEKAYKTGIKYLTILFHDRYFSDSFKSWKGWYVGTIGYLKNSGFEFTTYREAIQELEKKV